MRWGSIIAALLVLVLSIISTTFTLLAATSKSWAAQNYYFDNGTELGLTQFSPVCVYQRSPFYRCGLPRVYENGTCRIDDCTFYSPYGHNQTSCRSATEFGRIWAENVLARGLLGMSQECQEGVFKFRVPRIETELLTIRATVHYAGNLQIAASFFITSGLCLALVLSIFTVTASLLSSSEAPASYRQRGSKATEACQTELNEQPEQSTQPGHKSSKPSARSKATPYVVSVLLSCLYVGAVMQILAQCFGVLGLTVNATPSAQSAKDTVHNSDWVYFVADSWAIGKGSSMYATTAWASALACAALATTVFRTPRFPKIL